MKILKNFLLLAVVLSTIFSAVSCTDTPDNKTEIESIFLSESSIDFSVLGETRTVTATVLPTNAKDKTVTWSSSDESVATCVDGVITAVGYGICLVRATCGTVSSVCTVQIQNPYPRVSIPEEEVLLEELESTKQLTAISNANEDITDDVTWISSNPSIVSCIGGMITAKGYGVCKITAIEKNGDYDVSTIIVKDPNEQSLTLSKSELRLDVGQSYLLGFTKTDLAGDNVSWISSNEQIATCENGEVAAVSDGVCAIIAITENGISDCCVVTVGNYAPSSPPAQIVKFDVPEIPTKLSYVDKSTGKITSVSVATSYNLKSFISESGRLRMVIEINCVKIYDINGTDGKSPVAVTTQLYKENGIAALGKETKKYTSIAVGETFKIPIMEFYVESPQSNKPRELYILFDRYTEI